MLHIAVRQCLAEVNRRELVYIGFCRDVLLEVGVICSAHNAHLKQYIAAEADVDKLAAIDFGKALPDSYMQQLAALLSSAGIDITKYTAALTGG